ncbi:MAG: tRNA lysidine(34) synthetase TilS [Anaerovoracaceae bacterium]
MVKQTIKDTIDKYKLIEQGDTVVIGLSGGPDSLCLFDVLVELSHEMELTLHGAHVNHQFRPGAADEDQLYVENLCQDNGVCNWAVSLDCNAIAKEYGLTSEEAGRKARYEFFDKVANTIVEEGTPRDKVKIAIAQNLNDQAETILFRLLRGTGIDGLSGIEYKRTTPYNNTIIRPLLDVSRNEIEAYCEDNQLEPCIDKTNYEPIYARNKIRLELIPYLKENYNYNIVELMNRLSQIAREDKSFIWQCAEEAYNEALISKGKSVCKLKLEVMSNLHSSVLRRIILKAFSEIGLFKDIAFNHLEQCEKLVRTGQTPNQLDLPNNYIIRISYDKVICEKKNKALKQSVKLPTINIVSRGDYIPKEGVCAFDYDLIQKEYGTVNLVTRKREAGDFIRIKGTGGRKKIQNLFVDLKVPREKRNEIYFVAIGKEVLYIPQGIMPARYSGNYDITERTKKIITVEFEAGL